MRICRSAVPIFVLSVGLWGVALSPASAADTPAASAAVAMSQEEALALAARNRPEFAALRADLEAAALKLRYAGLPPNPELGIEWDNLGGDLPADEVRETEVSLRQPIEIGGKPAARKMRVQNEILQLQQEEITTWLDIAAEVRTAFLEVLAAREQLALQQDAEIIAAELAGITRERVAAGELPATEETRAEAGRAATAAETQKCRSLLVDAELALVAVLAEPERTAVTVGGELAREVSIPDRQEMLARVQDSPFLALRRSERRLASAGLAVEQAGAWADPSLSLALRDMPDKDGSAVAVGVSIPLPLFQRNQTALAEAGASARKAAANEEAAVRLLRSEALKTHALLEAADQEARTLRNEVLSRAGEAAESLREGFRAGKFRYSDVLESSQTLVAMKERHLDVLVDLNRAAIALDRLLGRPAYPGAQNFSSSSHDRSTP